MPQISVIVPVYKVEKYIHRCVDSILAQTFTDFELILVDDGSPDNCGAICDEYAARDSRIHVIHQQNGGLSAARNAGIDWSFANSNSQWLTFIDSDDWVHPQMLELLVTCALNHNVKLSMCDLIEVTSDPTSDFEETDLSVSLKPATEDEMHFLFYGEGNGGYACGKLIAKELIDGIRFEKGRIFEDSAVTCRWFHKAGVFAAIPLCLYFYFVNDQGIRRSPFSLKQLDILWSKSEQEQFYKSIGYHHMQSVVVSSSIVSAARCYRALITELKDKATAKNVKVFLLKKYFENRKVIVLTSDEKRYVMQMLHPKLMDTYWFFCAQWRKFTNH